MSSHSWCIYARDLKYKFNKIKYKSCLREIEKNFMYSSKAYGRKARLNDVELKKYYEGFNTGREKTMFQEELGDLEIVYKTALKNYAKEVEDVLPTLLYYMEKFLTVHKQNEVIREKLDTLLAKTGREPQEETGDEYCQGGCNE